MYQRMIIYVYISRKVSVVFFWNKKILKIPKYFNLAEKCEVRKTCILSTVSRESVSQSLCHIHLPGAVVRRALTRDPKFELVNPATPHRYHKNEKNECPIIRIVQFLP